MKGGLVDPADGVSATAVGTTGGPPSATGSPPVPEQSAQTQSGGAGQGPGVSTAVGVGEMGPVDRLLVNTTWTRDDVELVLQAISTLLLLYWAVTEVQA